MPRELTVEQIIQADQERGLQAMQLAAAQLRVPLPDASDHWVEHERYAVRRAHLAEAIMRRLN